MVFYWYPGAVRKPLTRNFTNATRKRTDGVVLHVAASEAASLQGWFNSPAARASSHFYIRRSGVVEQYLPINLISWAGVDSDARTISIETQGMGSGTWDPAQVDAIVAVLRWIRTIYPFPARQMTSSKSTEKGIGYHALGVPGSSWQKLRRVSQTGGELWSGAVGKICPGPGRVAQIPAIISRLSSTTTAPAPQATPAPPATSGTPIAAHLDVKTVQRQLAEVGFYTGLIDGQAGSMTGAAVLAYQKNQRYFPGLLIDGNWGDLTQRHFEWVKVLQSAVNRWKTAGRMGATKVDGVYGAYVDRLVRATIADNFNGTYTAAVKAIYGRSARPVNDGEPGAAFCRMLSIPTHPMATK